MLPASLPVALVLLRPLVLGLLLLGLGLLVFLPGQRLRENAREISSQNTSLSPSLPAQQLKGGPFLEHTHSLSRRHARTHARTHTHTHTYTHSLTRMHAHARTHARTHAHAHMHTHARNTPRETHTRKHTHTHTSTHTQHTHTHRDREREG